MIQTTLVAAEKIKKLLSKRDSGIGIKLGVKTTGCSGLAYNLEYVDVTPVEYDYILNESNGVKLFIEKKSFQYLDGLTIDYVKKGLNEGFEFLNPNETGRCGCGESFKI